MSSSNLFRAASDSWSEEILFDHRHSMSGFTCIFSSMNLSFESAQPLHLPCSGRLEKLSSVEGRDHLFGCENVVDLILLRGGILIDWEDKEKTRAIFDMFLCANHKKQLLTSWKSNSFGNKKTQHKKLTCSLPQIEHESKSRPETSRRLHKSDTLRFIESTGRFIHVGTAVCTLHEKAIIEKNFDLLSFSTGIANQTEDSTPPVSMDDFPSDDDASIPHEDESWIDNGSVHSLDLDEQQSSTGNEDSSNEKKLSCLREIASLFGLSRITGDKPWKDLQPETRRKKICSMVHLHEEMYKLCAGEDWKVMRTECIRKIGQIADSSRVSQILQSIDQRIEDSVDRRSKLSLVSVLVGHFTEKEIIHSTGVTRYFIREAKKFALCGLDEIVKLRRVRYNLPNLKTFVGFISRPEIIVNAPKPGRSFTLSSGESISMADVIRLHSYRQIFAMYKSFMEVFSLVLTCFVIVFSFTMRGVEECAATGSDVKEFVRTHSLGFSTCVKLMEKLLPVRSVRMQCVDNFHSEALEAFNCVFACVTELKQKGCLSETEAFDLNRRFQVATIYLSGFFRQHLRLSSTCSSHCIRFALSDRLSEEYRSECDHQHEDSCEKCNDVLSVFSTFKQFLTEKATEAVSSNNPYRFRLSRMVDETAEGEVKVSEYQKHLVRAAMSELDRVAAIDSLTDSSCLITMDFSLKLMPSGFVESQSQWFGKAGISFHVSHVLISKAGQHFHHTLGHLNDDSKQDSVAVLTIADHVFQVLAENGVKSVTIRSDNAANYRNASVIYTLRTIATKYGLFFTAYLFSEAQAGKGSADRQISHSKRKLIGVINSGGYGRNAEEILDSLTTAPLLKSFSFYQITGEVVRKSERSISGITSLGSFQYENDGVRIRKFNSLGEGNLIPYSNLEETTFTYEILKQGGHLSKSDDFWGELTEKQPKKDKKVKVCESEDEEEEKIFRCPSDGCKMSYLTVNGLENHLLIGQHKVTKHSDTIVEAAARLFSESVETNEAAYQSMRVDSIASSLPITHPLKLKEGWAVRVKNRTMLIEPEVRREVRRYFVARRKEGKRAEARVVVQMLRSKTNQDGSYAFPLKTCLRESQAQGLINRMLKVEQSKEGLKALESEIEEEINEEEEEENGVAEEFVAPSMQSVKKGRGRPRKEELPVQRKSSRKGKSAPPKKATIRKNTTECSDENGNEKEGNNNKELEDCDSNVIEEESTKKRGRPKKSSATVDKPVKSISRGRKVKADTDDTSDSPLPTRVLRSRKRRNVEEEKSYCEISSDEEIDDYTLFMNVAHENFSELFSDEE